MQIKVNDMALLMRYLLKEGAQYVDVNVESTKGGAIFEFTDVERRVCAIRIFRAELNSTPELTKIMRLTTRFEAEGLKKILQEAADAQTHDDDGKDSDSSER